MDYELFDKAMERLEAGLPPPQQAGLFGASLAPRDAKIHVLTVPWEVTTSFGAGTSGAPEAVREASHQLDLQDHTLGPIYQQGICSQEVEAVAALNQELKPRADKVIKALEQGQEPTPEDLQAVNQGSSQVNQQVYAQATACLAEAKKVGLLGGDHSAPYGLIKAVSERYPCLGVLHIDAHHDLRLAYEGFEHSHASVFRNVMTDCPGVTKLVSVGVRDFSLEEQSFAESSQGRIVTFYDEQLYAAQARGKTWHQLVQKIIQELPEDVYVSLDIDGLAPEFCPSTGTPVPGGLSYHQVTYLITELYASAKQVRGFDLVEVGQEAWDANVGARLLYKLCGLL